MTVKEAAMELDMLPGTVTKYLRQGKLQGKKAKELRRRFRGGKAEMILATVWVVNGRSVRGFLRQRGG